MTPRTAARQPSPSPSTSCITAKAANLIHWRSNCRRHQNHLEVFCSATERWVPVPEFPTQQIWMGPHLCRCCCPRTILWRPVSRQLLHIKPCWRVKWAAGLWDGVIWAGTGIYREGLEQRRSRSLWRRRKSSRSRSHLVSWGSGAGETVTGEGHSIAKTPAHRACAPSLRNCR